MSGGDLINAAISTEELEVSATITTEEPEIAATLSDLRYLVFQGMKGDTGDSAYEEAVALGFVGTEAEWIASLKGEKGDTGDSGAVFLELKTVSGRQVITYNGEQITGAEIDAMYLSGALPVVEYSGRIFAPNKNCYNSGSPSARNSSFMFSRPVSAIETTFISVRYDSSVVNIINAMVYPYFDSGDDEGKVLTVGDDDTLHWETPQGGSAENAVLYTPQSLTDSQKAQARTNVGAGTYSKPSGGIPKTDLAQAVKTSLGKADTALQPDALQTELDDNVPPAQFVLVRNGNTLSTVDTFYSIASLLFSTTRRVMFIIVVSQSGGTVTSALELYPTMINTNNRALTLAGYFDGIRYTAELTAASVSSTMTGTLVAKSIVTASDIPGASTSAPVMDGTAAAGTSAAYARGDHVHPSDTSKLGVSDNAYRSASIPMGHLDATSTATVMTATVDGITELRDGVCMWLRNGVITSASGFTININGLGAKPCYSSLAAESRSTTIFDVNYALLMIYNSTRVDGGCWDIVYGIDTNTTYTPPKLGFGYGTCTTAAATAAKTASISSYALNTGGIVSIKFDNDVPAGATLNITSKGAKAIYHRGAAITGGVIKAGDTATFVYSTYYHLIAIDRDEAGDTLPTVTASDNGKVLGVVNGAWGLKDDETGGGGGGTSPTLLGTTPLKLTADADNLILSGSGEISYALQSDTVADFPVLSGTANNATVTQENGVYVLTAGSGASAWYQAYIDITVTGLVVNQSYNFIFDAAGCEYDETTHRTIGHYILYDGSGNTLVTRGATDPNRLNSYAFTAPTTSVRVRWYPATNNTFSPGVSVATVNAIYINRTGTTEHTAILDASGTFTDSTTIPGVPAGTTVTSTPSCSVYSKASESGGAALPLEGKTVVCFGDSLFGLYRGSTSAPAFVEKVTGATVYNVGFGGCRMSDHPSHGYAEFSMWALAHAIATDTWTDQDTYVSQGSDYFPEQLATLKGIDFSTVDYAVIHYGTNDFGGGVAIGADSASTVHNTLCGALRYSIETLLTAYPKLRIFVSLPCFRFWTVDGQTVYSDTYTNSQNKTLVEYVAALRAVAGEYNIPVIENYTGNGINKVNASTFLGDGTHHNADGRERFGTYIAENLISGGGCGIAAAESNSFGGGA